MAEEIKNKKNEEEEQNKEKPLDKMIVKDLREIAKEIPGVTGVTSMKKDELLSLIKEHRGIKDDKPAKKKAKKASKKGFTPKEIKSIVITLKEEKETARGAEDKKKIDILRRRINRLKKQTRKVAKA